MKRGWKIRLCLLALAASRCCSPSIAQTDSQSNAQTAPIGREPHTLRGTVVDSVTGEPIYRALVQIGGQFAALTDHEGHFEFEGAPDMAGGNWAMKPGYFAEPGTQRYSASDANANQPLVIKLVPEAVVSGTVTGQDGGPLEGIHVELKTLAVSNGLERWETRQGTQTNSEGQYRFYELQAGKYAVVTGFHAEGLADEKNSIAYVPLRYPAMAGADAQSAMRLSPGERRVVDLAPDAQRLYPVVGVVNGYGESRGVGFQVRTSDGDEVAASSSHFNARTGEFRLLLPGGSYSVTARAYVQRGSLESSLQIAVPQPPGSGVSFALEPGAAIPVEIQTETVNQPAESTGSAIVGGLQAPPDSPRAYITLANVDDAGAYSASSPGRRGGGGAGPLVIENVPPGRYILQAQPSNGGDYVASAYCGAVDLLHEELAIANGIAGCSIRVVLRNDTGLAHVTIRDSDGSIARGAQNGADRVVYLLPIGDLVRQPVISSGWSPEYQGFPVPPGKYLALAMDHREELAYRDPEAMRRYAASGQEIAVAPNGTADAEVSLIHGDL
jgi:hypothetical protein